MIRLSPGCAFVLATFAATVCGPVLAVTGGPPAIVAEAQAAMARGDYATAATDYAAAASTAPPGLATDFQLLAAEASLLANDPGRAESLLGKLPVSQSLDAHQTARLQLLRARIAVAHNDFATAASLLPDKPSDPALADAMLLLRARALYHAGDPVAATAALVQRERYLTSTALDNNRSIIWSGLAGANADAIEPSRFGTVDTTTRGWLELARLARANASLEAYDGWRRRYPNHPGNEHLLTLMAPTSPIVAAPPPPPPAPPKPASPPAPAVPAVPPAAVTPAAPAVAATPGSPPMAAPPQSVPPPPAPSPVSAPAVPATPPPVPGAPALLLPLQGSFAPAGAALRDAFNSVQPAQPYDISGAQDGGVDLFHHAIADGASAVVGPLRKEDGAAIVASIGAGNASPVPLLLLNYLDPAIHPPTGVWQFGLSPEDEAQAAAVDAALRGLHRAVVLVPEGDWGERVAAAFRSRFESLQGSVIDSARYAAGTPDYSASIKGLLKLDAAQARFRSLGSLLGIKLEYEPRRRDDVDVIFVGARAAQARLITPQFRYYRAERLPIYGTSSVYDGSADGDLEGVRFCDVPALVQNTAAAGQTVDAVRFDALGRDAALLVKTIRSGPIAPDTVIAGISGQLSVDANGAFHRQLGCAEMVAGAVRPLAPPAAPATPPSGSPAPATP
jgi:hypothetical protein